MAITTQFAVEPIIDLAQVSVANANRDGTGTLATCATGPSTTAGPGVGKRINRVTIKAIVTTTAGMVRFYVSNDGGTTKRMITEIAVTAVTGSASLPEFESTVPALLGLVLPGSSNGILYASTEKAEAMNIITESANL